MAVGNDYANNALRSIWGRIFAISKDHGLLLNEHLAIDPPGTGAGSVNGSTIVAREQGMGSVHITTLTLTNTPLSVVSVTTGNGVGGFKLYTFPEGYIHVLGAHATNLDFSIASGKQADFTDATPEGQIGIGSLLPANADALGTDATDDDICTAADITFAAYAAADQTLKADAATLVLNGSSTAEDVNLTVLIDAADIDDGVTTEILVSGTVVVPWIFAGDL